MTGLGLLVTNVSEFTRLEMTYIVALCQAKAKATSLSEALSTPWIFYTFLILYNNHTMGPWNITGAQRKVIGSADSNSSWPESKHPC